MPYSTDAVPAKCDGPTPFSSPVCKCSVFVCVCMCVYVYVYVCVCVCVCKRRVCLFLANANGHIMMNWLRDFS